MILRAVLSFVVLLASMSLPQPTTFELMRRLSPDESIVSDERIALYAGEIDLTSLEFGIDRRTLIITAFNESNFHPSVSNVMQISRPWSVDPEGPGYCRMARRNPLASIRCGGYIYSKCEERFRGENVLVCWAGFHIDREAYLKEFKKRWKILT